MKKARRITDLVLGLAYIVFTLMGYLPAISLGEPIHFAEWCCITGLFGGLFYAVSAFQDGKMPEIFHLNVTLVLILIFIATIAMRLNLEGAFWFLHLYGPILVLIRFFLFCDCRKISRSGPVMTCIAFPLTYVLLAFVLLKTAGECPFPASMIFSLNRSGLICAILVGLCALLLALGHGLFYLNRFLHDPVRTGKNI